MCSAPMTRFRELSVGSHQRDWTCLTSDVDKPEPVLQSRAREQAIFSDYFFVGSEVGNHEICPKRPLSLNAGYQEYKRIHPVPVDSPPDRIRRAARA
jgi:hypothetical protein